MENHGNGVRQRPDLEEKRTRVVTGLPIPSEDDEAVVYDVLDPGSDRADLASVKDPDTLLFLGVYVLAVLYIHIYRVFFNKNVIVCIHFTQMESSIYISTFA